MEMLADLVRAACMEDEEEDEDEETFELFNVTCLESDSAAERPPQLDSDSRSSYGARLTPTRNDNAVGDSDVCHCMQVSIHSVSDRTGGPDLTHGESEQTGLSPGPSDGESMNLSP
eukprot:362076-Hanusia_phi.AAC.2